LTTPTDSGRIAGTLLGRTGEPDAVAATALVLACSDGSYFAGQWLSPNGRLLMD
jgi:NAD(P)-dependent dehydrogenase (short-subunit alcohol dehydrogenase family)